MRLESWILLAILGFLILPAVGFWVIGLFIFNYVTDIIFGLISRYRANRVR